MDAPTDDDILQAFRLIDSEIADGADRQLLLPLRSRLVGELLGDAERVEATLTKDFQLITYAGESKSVVGSEIVVEGVRRMGEAAGASLMWAEFEDLVCRADTLAAQGLLHRMQSTPTGVSITVMRLAIFIRFQGGLMKSETLYLDPAATETTVLEGVRIPDADQLRRTLDSLS